MAYDVKKAMKHLYQVKTSPSLVEVESANFIMVEGAGDPNDPAGAYHQAITMLYGVAYTLKMSERSSYKIDGFESYVVAPLEGLWWQEGLHGVDYQHKENFRWYSMIRLPDFIKEKDVEWAKGMVKEKKGIDCSALQFFTYHEGLCVQMMHYGSYDNEPASVLKMDQFIETSGYENDMNEERYHHEIYLSDPRKTAIEKLKTIIRHPIRKA